MVAILILWAHVSSVQCERKRRPYGWSNADENHLQRRINAQQLYSVYNKIEGATRFSSRRNFPFIRDDKCECEIWRKEEIELISNNECMHLSTSTLHENASHEWNDPTNRYIYIYIYAHKIQYETTFHNNSWSFIRPHKSYMACLLCTQQLSALHHQGHALQLLLYFIGGAMHIYHKIYRNLIDFWKYNLVFYYVWSTLVLNSAW